MFLVKDKEFGDVGREDGGLECINILRETHSLDVLSWLAFHLTVGAAGEPYHWESAMTLFRHHLGTFWKLLLGAYTRAPAIKGKKDI